MFLPPAVVHKSKPELHPDLSINQKHRTRKTERFSQSKVLSPRESELRSQEGYVWVEMAHMVRFSGNAVCSDLMGKIHLTSQWNLRNRKRGLKEKVI